MVTKLYNARHQMSRTPPLAGEVEFGGKLYLPAQVQGSPLRPGGNLPRILQGGGLRTDVLESHPDASCECLAPSMACASIDPPA
jgi:hypothetical protein